MSICPSPLPPHVYFQKIRPKMFRHYLAGTEERLSHQTSTSKRPISGVSHALQTSDKNLHIHSCNRGPRVLERTDCVLNSNTHTTSSTSQPLDLSSHFDFMTSWSTGLNFPHCPPLLQWDIYSRTESLLFYTPFPAGNGQGFLHFSPTFNFFHCSKSAFTSRLPHRPVNTALPI